MFDPVPVIRSRRDLEWCAFLRDQGRSGETIERALHNIGVMHPGGWSDWAHSRLNLTGSPVALNVMGGVASLSVVTEIDDPGRAPQMRLGQAHRLLGGMNGSPWPHLLSEIVAAAQADGPLDFGAWVGLSALGHSLDARIIAELPKGADDLVALVLKGRALALLRNIGGGVAPTRISYDDQRRLTHLRFETSLRPDEFVPVLLGIAGLSFGHLAAQMGRWLSARYSFSCSVDGAGFLHGLGVHIPTGVFAMPDTEVSDLVSTSSPYGMPAYHALMAQLEPAPAGTFHHSEIGFFIGPAGQIRPSVRLAAPWQCSGSLLCDCAGGENLVVRHAGKGLGVGEKPPI